MPQECPGLVSFKKNKSQSLSLLHGPIVERGPAVHSSGRESQQGRQEGRHVVALVLEQQVPEIDQV